jgi:hypothetical protein
MEASDEKAEKQCHGSAPEWQYPDNSQKGDEATNQSQNDEVANALTNGMGAGSTECHSIAEKKPDRDIGSGKLAFHTDRSAFRKKASQPRTSTFDVGLGSRDAYNILGIGCDEPNIVWTGWSGGAEGDVATPVLGWDRWRV